MLTTFLSFHLFFLSFFPSSVILPFLPSFLPSFLSSTSLDRRGASNKTKHAMGRFRVEESDCEQECREAEIDHRARLPPRWDRVDDRASAVVA